ncbi:MAG: DNA polymerase III subunit delta' [Gammaproteobacteria bacterium]
MSLELPWLAEPWAHAAQSLERGRVPTGLLILGRAGLGRGQLAEAIARALLCLEPRADATACGRCAACREMDAGAHPDFLSLHLLEGKTQILVEQVRELTRGLSLTAGAKGVRCAVVSPAEKLNATAANALLKTLEEPPAGVTLVLVAESASQLLPTIASRCLRLPVPIPAPEAALAWLNAREKRSDWPLLLALSAGAPLAAVDLAEAGDGNVNRNLQALMDAAARRADPLVVAGNFSAWSLARFAVLVAWLAWAVSRAATSTAAAPRAAWWPHEITELSTRADTRRLATAWREANRLAGDTRAVNDILAREHLILLFINAFRVDPRRS